MKNHKTLDKSILTIKHGIQLFFPGRVENVTTNGEDLLRIHIYRYKYNYIYKYLIWLTWSSRHPTRSSYAHSTYLSSKKKKQEKTTERDENIFHDPKEKASISKLMNKTSSFPPFADEEEKSGFSFQLNETSKIFVDNFQSCLSLFDPTDLLKSCLANKSEKYFFVEVCLLENNPTSPYRSIL